MIPPTPSTFTIRERYPFPKKDPDRAPHPSCQIFLDMGCPLSIPPQKERLIFEPFVNKELGYVFCPEILLDRWKMGTDSLKQGSRKLT